MENSGTAQQLPLDRLEPADDEDRLRRALFYCHCLHLYSKRTIELLLNRCDAGEFGPTLQERVPQLTDWQLESAYKLITCIHAHMAGLDHCAEDTPPWVLDFFSDIARETDELFPTPAAFDVIQKHGSWKREKMVRDVAAHTSEILKFTEAEGAPAGTAELCTSGSHNDEFNAQLGQFLIDSASYRSELLLFALSQPIEALRRHLEVFNG